MTEELARRVQSLFGGDSVMPASSFTDDARHENSREFINCVLHADISSSVQQVDCTRLVWLPDRGSKKAWQAVIDPTLTSPFSLTVNGTTIGPFTAATTTAAFQTALNAITTPETPQGWSVHGNFFIYPATTVVKSGTNESLTAYEVQWTPLVGDAWSTKVGARRLTKEGAFKRGSTQAAEFIHGIGFTIASSDSSDGGSGASGVGGCPCECVSNGDIIHNGVETVSRKTVPMVAQPFPGPNGTITLPGGNYVLTYNIGTSKWELDIGDLLTATYNDGSSATSATTMDGTLIMTIGVGVQPELELCVTGDVPPKSGSGSGA
jgi:hypothetical protein